MNNSIANKKESEIKKLTLLDGWSLGTGSMIGATIFVASGLMSSIAGPATSISFIICAAVTLIIALCYCEMSSAFPRSGGAYIYPKETMGKAGDSISFLTGWALYGGQGLGAAVLALTCANYVNAVLELSGAGFTFIPTYFAITLIILFTISNIIDTRLGNAIQLVSTFAVVGALAVFVAMGSFNIKGELLTPFMPNGFPAVITAAAIGWSSFGGWSVIPNMSSEFKNPARDVPLSMLLSLITCGISFGFIVIVMNGLLHYTQLGIEAAPLAAAAATVNKYGALIIAFGGIFAATSTLNGLMMTGSRMIYSMGREGSLPAKLGEVRKKNGVPAVALAVTGIGMLVLAATGMIYVILQMVAFVTAVSWIVSCICVYGLRKNRKDVNPLFKTPLYPITPAVAVVLSLFMISRLSSQAIMIGCAWIIFGFVLYLLFRFTGLKKFCKDA
ncbi:amino acid permease [Sedimentibacter hydroxybenzoicus DSM 7310]|uniref:Amino acid permease n=1 Tax=Sedimentibacter hydroxybenzoicus DSM 7310 TaxID=1123245 RepID=A0A974GWP6_SEDHY|nr:amino acid permease [Sedimentibacter hydroxybenzoicus]NYB74678.1 amino acid permease [Sedimentibacter hydroxybenzoicus DSM 7310]